jgi:hypothetical protein
MSEKEEVRTFVIILIGFAIITGTINTLSIS